MKNRNSGPVLLIILCGLFGMSSANAADKIKILFVYTESAKGLVEGAMQTNMAVHSSENVQAAQTVLNDSLLGDDTHGNVVELVSAGSVVVNDYYEDAATGGFANADNAHKGDTLKEMATDMNSRSDQLTATIGTTTFDLH